MVNDQLVKARITGSEWTDHWRPFLARIVELHRHHPKRLMVALVGAPGSGKSVLAEQLYWLSNKGFIPSCRVAALPMDGFQYSLEYLSAHSVTQADGSRILLRELKGSPETFDAQLLREHLERLRAHEETTYWPGYSRITHDPVPDMYRIHETDNLIIVEGNYLLIDREPFTGIRNYFDLSIFLEAPPISIMANLMERHLTGGKTVDEAKEWVKRIDLPNARLVEISRDHADVVIQRDRQDDFRAIFWRKEVTPDP